VKLLLENGAGPDFEDEGCQTPLSRAIEGGSVAVVRLLLAKEVKIDYKYNIVSKPHLHLYLNACLVDQWLILLPTS
jgi:ankyrin repeat protein